MGWRALRLRCETGAVPKYSRFFPVACALVLVAAAAAAQPSPAWEVWVFHPFRPGVLQQCKDIHRSPAFERDARPDPSDPLKAWVLQGPYTVKWQGGTFGKPAAPAAAVDTEKGIPRFLDGCFAVVVEGRPVLSGAAVPEFSARRLDFPVLVQLRNAAGEPGTFNLLPRFPGHLAEPVPGWAEFLPR